MIHLNNQFFNLLASVVSIALLTIPTFGFANPQDQIKNLRSDRELIIYQNITSSDSLAHLHELKQEAINIESPTLLAEVSYNIGIIEGNRKNYLNALPALTRAIENLPSLAPQDSLILFNDLAIAHIKLKEFSTAAKYIYILEGLYSRYPTLVNRLQIQLTSIDHLYHQAQMYTQALDWFNKMVDQNIYLDKSKPYTYVKQITDLGNYYLDLEQPDSAILKFQKAFGITESSNFTNKEILLGQIKGLMAKSYVDQNKHKMAIPLFKEEFLAHLRNKDSVACAQNLNQLAFSELKTKDYDNAIRHLKSISSLVSDSEHPEVYQKRNYTLSKVYGQLAQYDSAYYYGNLFIKFQENLINSQQAKDAHMVALSSQLEANEMRVERALLQEYKQRQLSSEILLTRNVAVVIGVLILIILIYVLYLLFKRNEQKLQLEKLIIEFENKANQLQESLFQKETLIKEVHHRVKNNLQIVSGILQLQAMHVKNEEISDFIKTSQNRIQSMALIHQLLYQNQNLNKISMKEYINKLVHQLFMQYRVNSTKIKTNYYVPEIEVNVDDAINLGLIINELITNVICHAYPDDEKGHLDIWLKHVKDFEYKLIIADDGPGLSDSVTNVEQVGLKLAGLLTGQLKSKLNYTYNNGAEFSFTFNLKKQNS